MQGVGLDRVDGRAWAPAGDQQAQQAQHQPAHGRDDQQQQGIRRVQVRKTAFRAGAEECDMHRPRRMAQHAGDESARGADQHGQQHQPDLSRTHPGAQRGQTLQARDVEPQAGEPAPAAAPTPRPFPR
jgi:hypothetical protein